MIFGLFPPEIIISGRVQQIEQKSVRKRYIPIEARHLRGRPESFGIAGFSAQNES